MNQLSTRSRSSASRSSRFGLIAILSACVLSILFQSPDRAQSFLPMGSTSALVVAAQEVIRLEPGKPIERELAGGETHSYQIALTVGQYLSLVVDQKFRDLVVTVFGPDGIQVNRFDSRWYGDEPVSVLGKVSGNYRVTIGLLQPTSTRGHYGIKIAELRESRPQDMDRLAAETISSEGKRLIAQGTKESLPLAQEKYETALQLWRALQDHFAEAQTLNAIGYINKELGAPRKSLEFYEQALSLRRGVKDTYGEAETLNNIAAAYSALGELRKAIDHYEQALLLRRALRDHGGEALALLNAGRMLWLLGEVDKALNYYRQALPLAQAVGDRRMEGGVLLGLGVISAAIGERQQALDYYLRTLPLFQDALDRRGEGAVRLNIGTIYRELGQAQESVEYSSQALAQFRAAADRRNEAVALNNLAVNYLSLGEKQKALEYHHQALALCQAMEDRVGEAQSLHNLGRVHAEMGEKQTAFDHLNRSLLIFRATGSRQWEAMALNSLGQLQALQGEWQSAHDYYQEALSRWQALGNPDGEASTRASLAHVERERGNLGEARAQIEAALEMMESVRVKVVSPDLRASYFVSAQKAYELYTDLLMKLHEQRPAEMLDAAALQVYERSRARSLLDLLAETRADIREGADTALLQQERSLQRQLNFKQRQRVQLLNGKHTPEQADVLEKELMALLAKYQQLQSQLRATSPRYAALTQPQPLNVREIQRQVLDEQTLLLEYALGEECSYLWVVTTRSIAGFKLPGRREVEAAARRVYDGLTVRNQEVKDEIPKQKQARVAQAEAQFPEAATALSQMLLGPVAAQLGKKRLLIVADGILQYLPFGVLPDPAVSAKQMPGANRKANGNNKQRPSTIHDQPLVVAHEIINLPSASTLAALRHNLTGRPTAPKAVIVLADPVFEPTDLRVKRGSEPKPATTPSAVTPDAASKHRAIRTVMDDAGVASAGQPIPRLPYSRREAAKIAALAAEPLRKIVLDFEVNHAVATSPELGNYRFVHFATHGLLDSRQPELSGILLSLVDEQGRPKEYGLLNLNEIYNLKLPVEMVVLSACQTALGKEVKGEGLVGLTRGFMHAGAARVVASLWKVDDQATAELMQHFYRGMLGARQLRPADALRQAQIEMWRTSKSSAPYYWGAFTLQGEWR